MSNMSNISVKFTFKSVKITEKSQIYRKRANFTEKCVQSKRKIECSCGPNLLAY